MPPSTRKVDDEAWLNSVAREMRRRLAKSPKFQTRAEPVDETNTDGWKVRLGHSRAAKTTHVELWFDHYFGLSRPKVFWAGFYWSSRSAFMKACGLWARRVRDSRRIANRDVSFRRDTYTLKQPRILGRLYLERYDAEFFLGVFSRPTPASRVAVLSEADRLLNSALTTDGRIDFGYVERRLLKKEQLAAFEDRHREAETACFRRNRKLLDERKRQDKYTCQVCDFRFARSYPGLTSEYAEAHHVVPLHKRKRRRPTTVADLRTVCANCHRMLHYRLLGTRADLKILRRMVMKARRAAAQNEL